MKKGTLSNSHYKPDGYLSIGSGWGFIIEDDSSDALRVQHSCKPNSKLEIVQYNGNPFIRLNVISRIKKGEFLTIGKDNLDYFCKEFVF